MSAIDNGDFPFHIAIGIEEAEAFVVQSVVDEIVARGIDVENVVGHGAALVFFPKDDGVVGHGTFHWEIVGCGILTAHALSGVGRGSHGLALGKDVARKCQSEHQGKE